jgi:hypothetical protein
MGGEGYDGTLSGIYHDQCLNKRWEGTSLLFILNVLISKYFILYIAFSALVRLHMEGLNGLILG